MNKFFWPLSKYVKSKQSSPGKFSAICVIIAFGLGGIFRIYFSPNQIRAWVLTAFEKGNPNFIVKLDEASISLSHNGIPEVALRLKDVHLKNKESCSKQPDIFFNEASVSFSFLALLKGKIIWGPIRFDQVSIAWPTTICSDELKNSNKQQKSNLASIDNKFNKLVVSTELSKLWNLLSQKWAMGLNTPFTSFFIKNLELSDPNNVTLTYIFKSLKLKFDYDEKQLRFSSGIGFQMTYQPQIILPYLKLEGVWGTNTLESMVHGNLKEGKINLRFQANLQQTEKEIITWTLDGSVYQIPLSFIISAINFGINDKNHELQSTWFSCNFHGQKLYNSTKEYIDLKTCNIEGDLGHISSNDLHFQIGKSQPTNKHFAFDLNNVSLKKIIGIFAPINNKLKSSIVDFGTLIGRIEFESWNNFKWKGKLNNITLTFSNLGNGFIQGRQSLDYVQGQIELKNDVIKGIFDKVAITRGNFIGTFNFEHSLSKNDSEFNLKIENFVFDPLVQKIITKGIVGNISSDIKWDLKNGAINNVRGNLLVDKIINDNYRIKHLTCDIAKYQSSWNFKPLVHNFEINNKSWAYAHFVKHLVSNDQINEWTEIKNLKGSLELNQDILFWKKLHGDLGYQKKLVTNGSWNEDGNVNGMLYLETKGKKNLALSLKGLYGSPIVNIEDPISETSFSSQSTNTQPLANPIKSDRK